MECFRLALQRHLNRSVKMMWRRDWVRANYPDGRPVELPHPLPPHRDVWSMDRLETAVASAQPYADVPGTHSVRHDQKAGIFKTYSHDAIEDDLSDSSCVDDGQRYSSLGPCTSSHVILPDAISLAVSGVTDNAAELTFALPTDAQVKLVAFDVAGRRLAIIENANLTRGVYNRTWNMGGLSSGTYFVRMTVNGVSVTRTVIRAR
jgi:hypothetical protein